jgi:hypothetical protein
MATAPNGNTGRRITVSKLLVSVAVAGVALSLLAPLGRFIHSTTGATALITFTVIFVAELEYFFWADVCPLLAVFWLLVEDWLPSVLRPQDSSRSANSRSSKWIPTRMSHPGASS